MPSVLAANQRRPHGRLNPHFCKRFATARPGYGAPAMRAVEVGAAVLVLMFGVLLLTGYMVSERLFGV